MVQKELTHLKNDRAVMVDITEKVEIQRSAIAQGSIKLSKLTLERIKFGTIEKGNVLSTARIAAIFAVKNTYEIIPLCHQIPITGIDINFSFSDDELIATIEIKSFGKTGVEMEAITGVSVALLTIWDMVKSLEKDDTGNYPYTSIKDIKVIEKIKGSKTN